MNLLQLQNRLIKLTKLIEFVSLKTFQQEFLDSDLEGFEQYIQFTTNKYNSTTLYRNDYFEIRLLCWKPQQETPKHSHPKNGCLMKILEGKLIEEKFVNDSSIKTVYKKDEVGYIKASELHILKNLDTDSVSLHLYSPSGFYDTIQNID